LQVKTSKPTVYVERKNRQDLKCQHEAGGRRGIKMGGEEMKRSVWERGQKKRSDLGVRGISTGGHGQGGRREEVIKIR